MWIAMILSILVTGLGLAYDGEVKKFIYYIVIQIILGGLLYAFFGYPPDFEENTAYCIYLFSIIVWVFGLYDTLRTTRQINMGQ